MKTLRLLGCTAVLTIPLMAADFDSAQAQKVPVTSTDKVPLPSTDKVPLPSTGTKPAPAPLIGVGLPAVGGVLLALALVRRFRRKE